MQGTPRVLPPQAHWSLSQVHPAGLCFGLNCRLFVATRRSALVLRVETVRFTCYEPKCVNGGLELLIIINSTDIFRLMEFKNHLPPRESFSCAVERKRAPLNIFGGISDSLHRADRWPPNRADCCDMFAHGRANRPIQEQIECVDASRKMS